MKKKYILFNLFLILITACLISFVYAQEFAEVNMYRDGKGKIELSPVPKSVGYKLQLKGVSKYKYLSIKFTKIGKYDRVENYRKLALNLLKINTFHFNYYLKDGKGHYKVVIFGNNSGQGSFKGLCYFEFDSTQDIPEKVPELDINDKIIEYVTTVTGKKVGRGECWDLAQEALDLYNADWKRPTEFGILLDPKKDKIRPGDIIQMFSLKLEFKNRVEYFGMPKHTAIIYKVISPNHFIIAHQNVAGKRYVMFAELDLKHVTKGNYYIYRPVGSLVPIKD